MLALLTEHASSWPTALVTQARQQVQLPVDSALFVRWLVQFLEMPRPPLGAHP